MFSGVRPHFPGQIRRRFLQRIGPTCLLDFAVQGLDTKLAFDLLGESQTVNCQWLPTSKRLAPPARPIEPLLPIGDGPVENPNNGLPGVRLSY